MISFDYLYNPDTANEIIGENHFVEKKLGFSVIENGIVLSHKNTFKNKSSKSGLGFGGIVDNKGEYIKSSFIHYGIGEPYNPPEESIQHSSETVIYLGLFYNLWGHDITDHLRRVWFLHSDAFKHNFKNCPVIYVPFGNGYWTLERQPNFRRLLEILGVDVEKIRPILQPTRFERIILPDESFYGESSGAGIFRKFTDEYCETVERVRQFALKNRMPTSNKKIYYLHGRRENTGAERLAGYFKSKGYEIISPEKLTFDEQLNLLINAESFASTLGSGSHNSIFLRDGTEAIFIPRKPYGFTAYQAALNQVRPLNANYVDSSLSIFSVRMFGPFCYIVSEPLKKFFGDKFNGYEEDDLKIFLQYVKDAISKNHVINQGAQEYYGTVLFDFMAQLKQREDLIGAYDMPPDWGNFCPRLTYQIHVGHKGWSAWLGENQISNPLDQKRDIQAIKVNFPGHKVYYSVYFNDAEGWSEEVLAPETAGTIGKSKPIFGIRIRLDEAGTKKFDILYRARKLDDIWTPWAKNGETVYSYGVKLNAIQIKLETKGTSSAQS